MKKLVQYIETELAVYRSDENHLKRNAKTEEERARLVRTGGRCDALEDLKETVKEWLWEEAVTE